ncbi:MAG: putative porin [Gammaproteobacteria bacterium]|jgi:hypothetical protein|nr:hypothetical protein [Chromatiales bacterium]MDP6674497.1 putative porin [Gammaproteobacteria bacterium]
MQFLKVGVMGALAVSISSLMIDTTTNMARADMISVDGFSMSADFRARLENDWDSQKSDGSSRDDRLRARIRARVAIKYQPDDTYEFGIRLRSGAENSHQSPHITVFDFDDNNTGDADFNFDKYYMKIKGSGFTAWAGRNSHPFWKQDEFFWDDDVTPLGAAVSYSTKVGSASNISINTGAFSMPVGMRDSTGSLVGGQGVYSVKVNDSTKLTFAAGYFVFDADMDDPEAGTLRNGNGLRDYETLVLNGQAKFNAGIPITIGANYYDNGENYTAADLATLSSHMTGVTASDTTGYAAFIKANVAKDWQVAYYYADIDGLAFNGSYGQDDWVRWGSSTEAESTNMKGHEFRVKYSIDGKSNLVLRGYFVESVTNQQDGNRARLDYNRKF